jgi:hypothetical protein
LRKDWVLGLGDPTAWLSELLKLGQLIKISLDELDLAINPKKD